MLAPEICWKKRTEIFGDLKGWNVVFYRQWRLSDNKEKDPGINTVQRSRHLQLIKRRKRRKESKRI